MLWILEAFHILAVFLRLMETDHCVASGVCVWVLPVGLCSYPDIVGTGGCKCLMLGYPGSFVQNVFIFSTRCQILEKWKHALKI